jgi:hypothetical protein
MPATFSLACARARPGAKAAMLTQATKARCARREMGFMLEGLQGWIVVKKENRPSK